MGHEWKETEFGEVVTDYVEQEAWGIQFYRNGSRRYASTECEIDEESAGREILRLAARVRELEAARAEALGHLEAALPGVQAKDSRIAALEEENRRLRAEIARRDRLDNPLAKPFDR